MIGSMVSISVPCIGEGRFQISVGLNPVLWKNSPKIGQAAGASAAAFLYAGCTLGQLSHDLAPLLGAQLRPAANLLNRAVTADADPLARVNGAQLDAGAVNLISFPKIVDILRFHVTVRICRARSRAPCKI